APAQPEAPVAPAPEAANSGSTAPAKSGGHKGKTSNAGTGDTITMMGLTVEKSEGHSSSAAATPPSAPSPTTKTPEAPAKSEQPMAMEPLVLLPSVPTSIRPWAPVDIDAKEYAYTEGVACPDMEVVMRGQKRMKHQLANFE